MTYIGSCLLGDGRTPKSALDIRNRRWVWASSAWINAGITLKIWMLLVLTYEVPGPALTDIEGSAQVYLVAVGSALGRIVRVKDVVSEVRVLLGGAVQVPNF